MGSRTDPIGQTLVERLRDPSRCTSWAAADDLMNEAATEIEALHELLRQVRTERDELAAKHYDTRRRSQKLADAGFTRRPSLRAMEMRAALELIAAPQRPDGTWNRDREACRQVASEALGRYED